MSETRRKRGRSASLSSPPSPSASSSSTSSSSSSGSSKSSGSSSQGSANSDGRSDSEGRSGSDREGSSREEPPPPAQPSSSDRVRSNRARDMKEAEGSRRSTAADKTPEDIERPNGSGTRKRDADGRKESDGHRDRDRKRSRRSRSRSRSRERGRDRDRRVSAKENGKVREEVPSKDGGDERGDTRKHQSSSVKRHEGSHRTHGGGKARVDGSNKDENDSRVRRSDGDADSRAKPAAAPKKVNVIVDQPAAVTGRTGGVYIPPFKLAQMRKEAAALGKATKEYQRIAWEALRKSINGLINKTWADLEATKYNSGKVNTTNIKMIAPELFQLNLVRGRGLFARAVMKAQLASPGFTPIFAALVAVVNTKLPENGELILKRVIVAFRRAYKRRDKVVATALAKFIAHMVNQQVAHELLALQLLTVLLEEPTDDSVEIAVNFTKEIGQVLQELSPQGLHAVFERFRGILHEGQIDKRVQYTIEALFAVRKSGFADHPAVPPELDLVERDDQITFEIGLEDKLEKEEMLDIFRVDDKYEENEAMWAKIKAEILGESDSDEEDDDDDDDDDSEEEAGDTQEQSKSHMTQQIQDLTEQDLVNLRRTIYLTIMSSAGFEECAHKLAKLDIQEGYEMELCNMMIECCSQERTWLPYYGLIAQRFCMMHRRWQDAFGECFETNYNTIHRLETNKLRNVAKFFAHLLYTDALPWTGLECIRLSEDATTSSSRIFIKILVLELSENMGLKNLRERFNDPYMAEIFQGMFPTDNPRNTRFAINFFTAIGLGGLTDGLRLHLKNAPKMIMEAQLAAAEAGGDSSSSSSSSSSSDSSSSDSSSDSSGSSSSDSSSDSDSDSD